MKPGLVWYGPLANSGALYFKDFASYVFDFIVWGIILGKHSVSRLCWDQTVTRRTGLLRWKMLYFSVATPPIFTHFEILIILRCIWRGVKDIDIILWYKKKSIKSTSMFFLNIPNNEQNPILTKTGLKLLAYKCIDENTADYQRLEYREMTLIYDAKIFRITGCIQLKP